MANTKQLDGGQVWTENEARDWWDSESGMFRIMRTQAGARQPWLLIAFDHDDAEGNPFTRRFASMQAAMEYAERM